MAESSNDRITRARNAALTRHAYSDTVVAPKRARDAFMAKFDDEVDPERVLDPVEREARARRARRVYMSNLARARHRKARQ